MDDDISMFEDDTSDECNKPKSFAEQVDSEITPAIRNTQSSLTLRGCKYLTS